MLGIETEIKIETFFTLASSPDVYLLFKDNILQILREMIECFIYVYNDRRLLIEGIYNLVCVHEEDLCQYAAIGSGSNNGPYPRKVHYCPFL